MIIRSIEKTEAHPFEILRSLRGTDKPYTAALGLRIAGKIGHPKERYL